MKVHQAWIPVVEKGHSIGSENGAKLWKVSSKPATPHEKVEAGDIKARDRIPTIEPLSAVSQYNKAVHPYKAVERLLTAEISHDAEAIDALQGYRISSADGGLWVKQIGGKSSDLGIALCLLMAVKNCSEQVIAATGALGDSQDTKDIHDSVVMPVDDMTRKLALIVDLKRQGNTLDGLRKVFVPNQHITYRGETQILAPVVDLPHIEILKNLGVEVICISTLSEALDSLKIPIASSSVKKSLNYFFLMALLAVCLFFGMKTAYLHRPVTLSWRFPESGYPNRPFLVCEYDSIRKKVRYQAIKDDKLVPTNVKIGIFVQSAPDQGWHTTFYALLHKWFGYKGLSLAMVLIGENSGIDAPNIVLQPSDQNRFIMPGHNFEDFLKIGNMAEHHLLMIVANRSQTVDVAELRGKIATRFKNEKPLRFSEVEQFISGLVNGSIAYNFTARDGEGCNEKQ